MDMLDMIIDLVKGIYIDRYVTGVQIDDWYCYLSKIC